VVDINVNIQHTLMAPESFDAQKDGKQDRLEKLKNGKDNVINIAEA
jgi:hypothetical protein